MIEGIITVWFTFSVPTNFYNNKKGDESGFLLFYYGGGTYSFQFTTTMLAVNESILP